MKTHCVAATSHLWGEMQSVCPCWWEMKPLCLYCLLPFLFPTRLPGLLGTAHFRVLPIPLLSGLL